MKLEREKHTPHSNLFEFGFDSLKLVRLASQLRRFYGLKLQDVLLGELIYTPTIDNIATIIDCIRAGTREETLRKPRMLSRSLRNSLRKHTRLSVQISLRVLPTSPLQDGVLYRPTTDSLLYFEHTLLKLHDGTSASKFKDAWETTIKCHEILQYALWRS